MSIQQSTELIIFVTHVEAEDTFLKIWGQVDKNSATCVERMILPLVEQFTRSQGCVGAQLSNLRINALCCARFQNEGYYRAKVINIRSDGMVVLQFIDYGNVEVLPPQEIHLLENIPGSESLQSFPPVAFDFTLMHVLPINGIWENKIIESIKKSLWYNEYKILIHSVISNHRFIKLWYNNEDFSELLIKGNMAMRATLQEMFRSKCVQQSQVPIYQQPRKQHIGDNCTTMTSMQTVKSLRCDGNEIHGFQRNLPLCCAAQQKHMMQTSVQEALVFKSRVLEVPSKHDVYVSFVEDGPHKFSVQLQSTAQILSMLMRDINSHPTKPLHEPPLPGSVCLGRYTQDKVLCRAVVMSVMENKCKLYYVDFGHTEVLPYTDIFQLPSHFINPRVLSIRFTLSGVHELNVTDEMKEYFKQVVSRKLLVLHVRPPEGPPLVQYGDLYDNDKNIKEVLRQAFPTPVAMKSVTSSFAYQKSKKLLKGAEEIVHVSFVESCRKFFVQLDTNIKLLELVMNDLADFCTTASTLSLTQLKIGLPCAALYDNQWYRAQILDINTDNIKVLYVDYGNVETVTLMSLRMIRDDSVRKLQAQAIKCILNGWELLPCTQEVNNQFELLILEKRLRMKIVDVNLDGIVIDLYDPEQNEDIKSQMLRIIGTEKIMDESVEYKDVENQHSTKTSSKINQSENVNKWHKKDQSDSWHQAQNNNAVQEKNKFKTWKDESHEGKLHENRNEKSNFHRNDTRNERFNRDDFPNNRSTRDKWNNRNEYNDAFKNGKGIRGGRNKTLGYTHKTHSSDKSWSDKDSDTSSRGSSRRGRSSARGSYSRRGGISGRTQTNKFSDRDSDGSFKGAKLNSDSYHGNNRFKERKGQGYRLTQNKLNAFNSFSDGEERRYSPMKTRNEFHIPSPNITIGATKTCEVVFTNSLSDFFIQLSPNYTALDSVMENIASIYENDGDLMKESEILCGVYCIAQYSEDLKWYRATVKSVEGNSATVQFVDYGNTETIKFNKIKSIQKEFLKLPVQAVHCKLLGIKNDTPCKEKIKNFEDTVSDKTLEAEFITEENGTYTILLKEVVNGCPSSTSINEKFCNDFNLAKAKEDAMFNKTNTITNTKQFSNTNYAPLDAKWTTISYAPKIKKDVIITWFTNPNNFYCQVLDNENEFRTMMNEIQKIYTGREPVSHILQIGSPVIAIFSDDGALYRAEIIELNKLNGHLIQYIDFGNSAVVDPQKIYPVELKLMQLPKQAVQCSLLNIVPQDGPDWSKVNTEAIDKCFNADKYECIFHDIKDNKYLISLINNGNDVANTLVEKNLALLNSETKPSITVEDKNIAIPTISFDVERMDINLLSGQSLKVRVSSVENTSKFYIQFPSAVECENIINTYMTEKNPEVLALPGELSMMQNQAIECSLVNITCFPEVDVALKECIEGKEVIIYVDEVDNNRLIVKLFDLNGDKINISEDLDDEKISPICSMPILSSTHKVSVSYADDSTSLWLQRSAEYTIEKGLIEALDKYYSTSGTLVEPKENLLCAVKSIDGHWYRAKLIKCTETGVYVNFIDYGSNEEVTPDVIMALDSRFYTPHQLAINASLPVSLNGTISEQLDILQNYLSNKELTAVFHNLNKKWVVELLDDGEKISDKFRTLNLTSQLEISETGKPQIYNMTVGCKYNVYVSHIDSPSQFWLQHVDDALHLSNKQEELQLQAPTFSQVDGVLEEGSLCVAVYTIDNLWYRAQVLDADEDITTVRFIDYGNTDIIDNKSGNIRLIPDSLKEIPEYSIKCRLDVIPIDSEDWSTTTCEKFENLITSIESLQAMIIANNVPKRVDLLINNKSVSEILVEDHCAVKVHTEDELIDEIVDLELDPHSAFVSHINSPNEFWVQEEKSVGDLEIITDRFIVAHMFPKVEEIKENLLCVAKYPEDECWYRARVISYNANATRVIYIDYGNSATSTEIRAIPADLADIPPLSRKCRLVMPEGVTEWSEKACEEFVTLAADGATIFLLDVLKEDETSLVKLTLDSKNITDILASFCKPIIEERLPPLGEENSPNVFIIRINSPDEFWIQTESSIADLNMMLDRLQAAPTFLPLNTSEIGTICAANYSEDGQWYRAKILSHSEHGTEVLYIDYGNTAITNDTRILPVDIINIPPLSKHCALQKPGTITCWSSEAYKMFEELAADGETMFQFEILDDTTDPIYVKLSFNGKNVVDILVPLFENITENAKTKENDLFKNKDVNNECSEESMKREDINETKRENIECYNADINECQDDTESEAQEVIADTNSCLSTVPVVELTVDEIVQNMKLDEPEENEEIKTTNSTIQSCKEKNSEEITKNLEHLEMQAQIETCSETRDIESNIKINREHTEMEISDGEGVINSETQICNNEIKICESNINIQCNENSKKENTLQSEEPANVQSTAMLEKTIPSNVSINILKEETNISSVIKEKKYEVEGYEIQDNSEINVSITDSNDCSEIKDINEKVSNLQFTETANKEYKLTEKQDPVLKDMGEEICSDSQPTEIASTECKITDKQDTVLENTDVKVSSDLQSIEIANKECKMINIQDTILKRKDEKVCSDLQPTEIASAECKVIDKQDTILENTDENASSDLQSIEIANKECKMINIQDTILKRKDEKVCSDLQPTEIASAECKVIDKQNTVLENTDENVSSDLQSTEIASKEYKITEKQNAVLKDMGEKVCSDLRSTEIESTECKIIEKQDTVSDDTDEEVFSDVQSTEIANDECKITDKQDEDFKHMDKKVCSESQSTETASKEYKIPDKQDTVLEGMGEEVDSDLQSTEIAGKESSITDKQDSILKNMDEKDLQSTEIVNNACKITEKRDTISLTDTIVSEKIDESNVENSL